MKNPLELRQCDCYAPCGELKQSSQSGKWFVFCHSCDIDTEDFDTERQAIWAWNCMEYRGDSEVV